MSRRPDGLLNHNVLEDDKGPQDACGVFGVWAPGEEVAKLAFYGLYALQHRGQESAGIATSDGERILIYKDMGLVSQVFTESDLAVLKGDLAIGHCRYSTTGSSTWVNAQPTLRPTKYGTIALAHNGNLTNTGDLAELVSKLDPTPARNGRGATTDTEIMTALIALQNEKNVEASALAVLPLLEGAFSLIFMDEHTLYAARDRHGVRPLVIGKLETGWVVASETAALDIVGAAFVREVEPGEFIAIDQDGLRAHPWAPAEPKGCLFEYVYLARPDTTIAGQGIHATRVKIGQQLAKEFPVDADLVIPVPESGTPAAIGYAKESGIPYGLGLVKNSYVGRTFIQPSQTIRQLGIIFLTNDGDIVNKILRASNNHEKEYVVRVNRPVTSEFIHRISNGVPILETTTNKCAVQQTGKDEFKIILTQGLNRQIRRMCEFLDYRVVSLKRIRIMNINLDIPLGKWRYFSSDELQELNRLVETSVKTYKEEIDSDTE